MAAAVAVRICGAFGLALLATLGLAPVGAPSYGLAGNVSAPALRVNAKGTAEVSWTQGAARRTFLVPKTGEGSHGTLAGADVLKPASGSLPMAVVVGQTPDGTTYALQRLAITGRPTSLDLSRWKGTPTQLTLNTDGKRLKGGVSFHGHPVTGSTPTPAGRPVKIYVWIECFGCPAKRNGWMLMLGVPPKADGSFSVYLRSSWAGSRYRATVAGPNVGVAFAPDARTMISAAP